MLSGLRSINNQLIGPALAGLLLFAGACLWEFGTFLTSTSAPTDNIRDSINAAPAGSLRVVHRDVIKSSWGDPSVIAFHVLDSKSVAHFWTVDVTGEYAAFTSYRTDCDLRRGCISPIERTNEWIDSTAAALAKESAGK